MTFLIASAWEVSGGLALIAAVAAGGVWLIRRHRPTPDEIELARRTYLALSGRLVDGMLLDVREIEEGDGRSVTLLFYSYRIGGLEYECAQDVTTLREAAEPTQVRAGFPCSVRYQPGSPQNSIVVAEEWSGLRIDPPATSPAPGSKARV